MTRSDNRGAGELRPVTMTPQYLIHPEGSVLIEAGRTKVICTASIEERVPPFLRNSGKGWVTAEYGMLPRATNTRTTREASSGKVGGRTQEIQRLIGRSLRAVTKLEELGERTVWVACDVIQADGGTRTASITGSYVALVLALRTLVQRGVLSHVPVDHVAAISVGVIIAGFGLNGRNLAHVLKETGIKYVIIAINPDTVKKEKLKGENIIYGDIGELRGS